MECESVGGGSSFCCNNQASKKTNWPLWQYSLLLCCYDKITDQNDLEGIFWPSQKLNVGRWRQELKEARVVEECLLSGISQSSFFHNPGLLSQGCDYPQWLYPTISIINQKLKCPEGLPTGQSDEGNPQFILPFLDDSILCQIKKN